MSEKKNLVANVFFHISGRHLKYSLFTLERFAFNRDGRRVKLCANGLNKESFQQNLGKLAGRKARLFVFSERRNEVLVGKKNHTFRNDVVDQAYLVGGGVKDFVRNDVHFFAVAIKSENVHATRDIIGVELVKFVGLDY